MLDSIVSGAREYNAAMEQAREATIPILSAHILAAIRAVQQAVTPNGNRLWLTWHAQFSDRQRRGAVASEGPLENAWYAALVDDNAADVLATTWVTGATYATANTPHTLGWLLTRKVDRAAKAVLEMYTRETYFYTAPPEWVEGIIRDALPDLIANAGYEAVWAAFEALLKPVQTADTKVLAALRAIREQYEGGPPLV